MTCGLEPVGAEEIDSMSSAPGLLWQGELPPGPSVHLNTYLDQGARRVED